MLARVPVNRIRRRNAYEFFTGGQDGWAAWKKNLDSRTAMLTREFRERWKTISLSPWM
jgi:hypothetical protein